MHRRRSEGRPDGRKKQLDTRDNFGYGSLVPFESRALLGRSQDKIRRSNKLIYKRSAEPVPLAKHVSFLIISLLK